MNDGGAAFPEHDAHGLVWQQGMTLRDWFAGMALCGWYTNSGSLPHHEHIARYAAHFYEMADTMLTEREKAK